jgi:hypothetical protein
MLWYSKLRQVIRACQYSQDLTPPDVMPISFDAPPIHHNMSKHLEHAIRLPQHSFNLVAAFMTALHHPVNDWLVLHQLGRHPHGRHSTEDASHECQGSHDNCDNNRDQRA